MKESAEEILPESEVEMELKVVVITLSVTITVSNTLMMGIVVGDTLTLILESELAPLVLTLRDIRWIFRTVMIRQCRAAHAHRDDECQACDY